MTILPSILEILKHRGISSKEDVEEFLSAKPQKTYDPFLLNNMEAGVDLILSAIESGAKICIYGDYDTDGVTSVALLRDVLLELGGDVTYYIPSRFDEGYGLNSSALDKIKAAGTDLVITVDCGCTSVEEARHAEELGMEILITDHHSMKERIPECLIINPQHPQCPYPFKSLAGVGVAFKLAQALVETTGMPKRVLTRNLDLVCIGTIGDVVPLVDENRMLVKYGMKALNITQRPGLKILIEKIGLHLGVISSRNVGFIISPHINAAGRMENATLAAKLMQEKNPSKAAEMADLLIDCNIKRKNIQQNLVERAEDLLKDRNPDDKYLLVKFDDAHEGVIGIAASRIKEKYSLPTIIVTSIDDGYCKGTGRSPEGVNLFGILSKYEHLFERFGGHAAACGFTIKEDKIEELKSALQQETSALYRLNKEPFEGVIKPEAILAPEEVSMEFINQQKFLEPFGKDNPEPIIGVELRDYKTFRMGSEGQYMRLVGTMESGESIKAVDFDRADEHQDILDKAELKGLKVTAVGTLEEKIWNGESSLQINLKAVNI